MLQCSNVAMLQCRNAAMLQCYKFAIMSKKEIFKFCGICCIYQVLLIAIPLHAHPSAVQEVGTKFIEAI
jgi:hypothetical protein